MAFGDPQNQSQPSAPIDFETQKSYLTTSLQQSKITDEQRGQVWDTFVNSKDEDDFTNKVNSNLKWMSNDQKDNLYQLRYKPQMYMNAGGDPKSRTDQMKDATVEAQQAAPPTPSPAIAPAPPQAAPQRGLLGQAWDYFGKPLIDQSQQPIEQLMSTVGHATAGELAKRGYPNAAKAVSIYTGMQEGVSDFETAMSSPKALGTMWATGGLSKIGPAGMIATKLINGGFSIDTVHSMYQQYPEVKKAIDSGDYEAAARAITNFGGSAATAVSAAHGFLQGEFSGTAKPSEAVGATDQTSRPLLPRPGDVAGKQAQIPAPQTPVTPFDSDAAVEYVNKKSNQPKAPVSAVNAGRDTPVSRNETAQTQADEIIMEPDSTGTFEAKQGGHAGNGVASVEELARQGRFVKINRSGIATDQGKSPDFNLKTGEAGYQVMPDGTMELKAGTETPSTKSGVSRYASMVFPAAKVQTATPQRQYTETIDGMQPVPSKVGEGTSAVGLTTEPPKTNVTQQIQSHTSEIERFASVLRNPAATPEEKAYAQIAQQDAADQRFALQTSQAVPTAIAPRPEVAQESPESGLNSLTPEQQDIAATHVAVAQAKTETAGVAPEENQMRSWVESQGGIWKGLGLGGLLAEYMAPPKEHDGATGVSITSHVGKMSKEFVRSEFDRKKSESPIVPKASPAPSSAPVSQSSPTIPAHVNNLFDIISTQHVLKNNAATDVERASLQAQQDKAKSLVRGRVRQMIQQNTPEHNIIISQRAAQVSRRLIAQADAMDAVTTQHDNTRSDVQFLRQQMSSGGYVVAGTHPETGEKVASKIPSLVKRGVRDLLHELMGEKPFTTMDEFVPRPKPAKVSEADYQKNLQKGMAAIRALRMEIMRDFELRSMIPGADQESLEDSPLWEKLENLALTESTIGFYRSAEDETRGRRPKLPPQMGPQGEITSQGPLEGWTQAKLRAALGKSSINTIEQGMKEVKDAVVKKRELARLHDVLKSVIDKHVRPQTTVDPSTEVGVTPVDAVSTPSSFEPQIQRRPGSKKQVAEARPNTVTLASAKRNPQDLNERTHEIMKDGQVLGSVRVTIEPKNNNLKLELEGFGAVGKSFEQMIDDLRTKYPSAQSVTIMNNRTGQLSPAMPLTPLAQATERGAVGTQQFTVRESVYSGKTLLDRARDMNLKAIEYNTVSNDHTILAGWIAPKGKFAIENPFVGDNQLMTHEQTASHLLPELTPNGRMGSFGAQNALIDHDWIRKAGANQYEISGTNPDTLKALELDMFRSRSYGQKTLITVRDGNEANDYELNVYQSLDKALSTAQPVATYPVQQDLGASDPHQRGVSGRGVMQSMVVGGLAGATLVPGNWTAAGLGMLGGVGLHILGTSKPLQNMIFNVLHVARPTGANLDSWVNGVPQQPPMPGVLDTIARKQYGGMHASELSLVQRIAQMPGGFIQAAFDRLNYFNQRPGALATFVMRNDPKGLAFRTGQQVSVNEDPYVSAWLAAGGGYGPIAAENLDFKDIVTDALKAGLLNHLISYLNLAGYTRAWELMREKIQNIHAEMANTAAQMRDPKTSWEEAARLQAKQSHAKSDLDELMERVKKGDVVPEKLDPQMIQKLKGQLQQSMKPTEWSYLQQLANRQFTLARKVLDMYYGSGMLSDADYQKYVARGNEYVPMNRIAQDMAGQTLRWAGGNKGNPLYVSQQNAIHALYGSNKTNVNPIVAQAKLNGVMLKEIQRNNVIKDFIALGDQNPAIKSLFYQVSPTYELKQGQAFVGMYEHGKPLTYVTEEWAASLLQNSSPAAVKTAMTAYLNYGKRFFGNAVTMLNFGFLSTRITRDLAGAMTISKGGIFTGRLDPASEGGKFVRNWLNNLYHAWQQDQTFRDYLRGQAGFGTIQYQINPEKALGMDELERLADPLAARSEGLAKKFGKVFHISTVEHLNKVAEDAIKMTTYQNMLQRGATIKEAAWETQRYGGMPMAARTGTYGPAMNLALMFFNVEKEGLRRVFGRVGDIMDAFTDKQTITKHNTPNGPQWRATPKSTAFQKMMLGMALVSALSMTLSAWNWSQKDSNGEPLMRKETREDRERNWIIQTGMKHTTNGVEKGIALKLSKPDWYKVIGNPIESFVDKMVGHEDRTGTQLALDQLGRMIPGEPNIKEGHVGKSLATGIASSINPAVKIPVEQFANYQNDSGGRPIVPTRDQQIESQFQSTPSTSPVAKTVGQGGVKGIATGAAVGGLEGGLTAGIGGAAVGATGGAIAGATHLSPERIDHIQRNLAGGIGQQVGSVANPFLGQDVQQPTAAEGPAKLRQIPAVGPIIARQFTSDMDQEMQDLESQFYDNLDRLTMKYHTFNELQKAGNDKAGEYFEANHADIARGQMVEGLAKNLSGLNKKIAQIKADKNMTPTERENTLRSWVEGKKRTLRAFNGLVNQQGKSSGYNKSFDTTTR